MRDLTNVTGAEASRGNVPQDGPGRRPRGGVLAVEVVAAGQIVLTSSRFTCEGCVRRARAALDAERAVTAVEAVAPGSLVVRYDPYRARPAKLVDVARTALEADPHKLRPGDAALRRLLVCFEGCPPGAGEHPHGRHAGRDQVVEDHANPYDPAEMPVGQDAALVDPD